MLCTVGDERVNRILLRAWPTADARGGSCMDPGECTRRRAQVSLSGTEVLCEKAGLLSGIC
ncbi:MAG: hypothetical protein WBN68_17605 [Sedimenticolaceae bacterium]